MMSPLNTSIERAIAASELLKAAILVHPKQLPRAGVVGKQVLQLIEAINEIKVHYDRIMP